MDARVKQRTGSSKTAVDETQAFTYAVSHDVRAPLAVIEGYAIPFAARPPEDLEADARSEVEQSGQN